MCSRPVAVAPDTERGGVVQETVDNGTGDYLVSGDLASVGEATVGSERHRATVVATAPHLEDPGR